MDIYDNQAVNHHSEWEAYRCEQDEDHYLYAQKQRLTLKPRPQQYWKKYQQSHTQNDHRCNNNIIYAVYYHAGQNDW